MPKTPDRMLREAAGQVQYAYEHRNTDRAKAFGKLHEAHASILGALFSIELVLGLDPETPAKVRARLEELLKAQPTK
jgi:hypothetical protein